MVIKNASTSLDWDNIESCTWWVCWLWRHRCRTASWRRVWSGACWPWRQRWTPVCCCPRSSSWQTPSSGGTWWWHSGPAWRESKTCIRPGPQCSALPPTPDLSFYWVHQWYIKLESRHFILWSLLPSFAPSRVRSKHTSDHVSVYLTINRSMLCF